MQKKTLTFILAAASLYFTSFVIKSQPAGGAAPYYVVEP